LPKQSIEVYNRGKKIYPPNFSRRILNFELERSDLTVSLPKFHIALSVDRLDASIREYSQRLGCDPCLVVPNEYALWRTETLNFSIRCDGEKSGTLRHLGWEDESAQQFDRETDVNGIDWERFAFGHQQQEIDSIWPGQARR